MIRIIKQILSAKRVKIKIERFQEWKLISSEPRKCVDIKTIYRNYTEIGRLM